MSDVNLSTEAERTLACVLDCLVPPSEAGGAPGAGELGLASPVAERCAVALELVTAGLATLDALAAARGAADFSAVPPSERAALLDEGATQHPGLLPMLIFHTYALYYQHPRVIETLGIEARPPFPKGYEVETGDLGLLERVRARGKCYREVDPR